MTKSTDSLIPNFFNIDPPHNQTNLNSPIATTLPTTNHQIMPFQIKMIGHMTDCNFYIPDVTGDDTGMAFRMAYNAAKESKNNKELCAYVGSMLCSVVPGFKNTVETTLNSIGIRPRFVSLPSQAHENNIVDSELSSLDWPSILVIFGYCILLLFKFNFNNNEDGYGKYISNCIRGLKAKVGWDPSNKLDTIPFDATKANSISAMLGSRDLRATVMMFLMNNSNHHDSQIGNVCKYLNIILSWSEMLVTTRSSVVYDPRVLEEVMNFAEAFTDLLSQPYPQYFKHLGLVSELLKAESSNFPTLFAVVKELQSGRDGSNSVRINRYSSCN
jgi:hypothetical protein